MFTRVGLNNPMSLLCISHILVGLYLSLNNEHFQNVLQMGFRFKIKHLYLGGGFKQFLIFTPICGKFPIWLIFLKGIETTNQFYKINEPGNVISSPWIYEGKQLNQRAFNLLSQTLAKGESIERIWCSFESWPNWAVDEIMFDSIVVLLRFFH